MLPLDLLEAASERISMIYKDAIFGEENDDGQLILEEREVEVSIFHAGRCALFESQRFPS